MDITPYVESLRHDLAVAAAAGGPDVQAAAERLTLALEPALRLTAMELLSDAAAQITGDLPAGSVEVRMRGREPQLVVDVPAVAPRSSEEPTQALPLAEEEGEEDGAIARITLRIPESVKTRAEELAARSGHSLNGWIVSALRAATTQRAVNVDIDLSSLPFFDEGPGGRGRPGSRRMSGWV